MRRQPMLGTDNELHLPRLAFRRHRDWPHLQSNFGNDNDATAHNRSQQQPCCSCPIPIGRLLRGSYPRAAASFHLINA
jgi:hypothetical protein